MATQSQLNDIKKQNKYTNVTLYHENNIKGQGINILNIDSGDHGEGTNNRVHDSASDANIYTVGMSAYSKDNTMITSLEYKNNIYTLEEFIKTFNIKIITRSLGGDTSEGTYESKFWLNLRNKYNLILNQSSGNNPNGIGASIPHDVCMWHSGVTLNRNGQPIKAVWSAKGEQIDFCNFSGFLDGTSFSSPYCAGEEALILQRFHENMSHNEMYKFLQMICEDLYEKGDDIETGNGLPILPTLDKKYITMTTKSNKYIVNNIEKNIDTFPVNNNGTVYVPIRFIAEEFGYKIKTSFNKNKTIHIIMTKEGKEIILNTNDEIMYINGTPIPMVDANGKIQKPYIDKNNRTLIPIRQIALAFGCEIFWEQSESRIGILG